MSSNPFMPLWIADVLQDTIELDAKETGAYLLLIMALWRNGGSLRNDPDKIRRVCRVAGGWPKVWAKLLPFLSVDDGLIRQGRLTRELQKRNAIRDVRSTAGRLGGEAAAARRDENTAKIPQKYDKKCALISDNPSKCNEYGVENGGYTRA